MLFFCCHSSLVLAALVALLVVRVIFYFVFQKNGAGKASGSGISSLNPFVSIELATVCSASPSVRKELCASYLCSVVLSV